VSNKAPVRLGILGCGHWGHNYVRIFSNCPDVVLAGVAEPVETRRAAAARTAHGVFTTADHRELFDGRCDAVVISTHAATHHRLASEAIEAGLDVLVEKPLTLSASDAADLVERARQKDKILMVAHTFLYNPSVWKLRQLVKDGILGDVYYIKARRTHLGLIREDVNAVWDLAPHDISMFIYLLEEEPATVQAQARCMLRDGREDVAFINLQFPSGIIGNIVVSWADSNKERWLDIVGSRARASFDDLNTAEPVRIFYKGVSLPSPGDENFGEFKHLVRDGEIVSPKIAVQEPLRVLCEDFIASIRERRAPLSDGDLGRKVVSVLERIDRSLGKTPPR